MSTKDNHILPYRYRAYGGSFGSDTKLTIWVAFESDYGIIKDDLKEQLRNLWTGLGLGPVGETLHNGIMHRGLPTLVFTVEKDITLKQVSLFIDRVKLFYTEHGRLAIQ